MPRILLIQWHRQLAIVGILVLIYAYHWNAVRSAKNEGFAMCQAVVEQANKASERKANEALRNPAFADCPLGKWNRSTGTCEP